MQLDLSTAVAGIAKAVAVATIIGGGTIVLGAQRDNAVQDQRIEQLQKDNATLGDAVDRLNESVQTLDRNVAVLNERLTVIAP